MVPMDPMDPWILCYFSCIICLLSLLIEYLIRGKAQFEKKRNNILFKRGVQSEDCHALF